MTRRARGYAVGAFAFAAVANLIALAGAGHGHLGTGEPAGGLTTTLGDTRYGTWWLVRVGVLLLFAAVLLGAAWWWPWRRRRATILVLVASAALPLPFSMISHAGAEPAGQATAVAFDYVHLLGASLWAGGLLFLVVVAGADPGRPDCRRAPRRPRSRHAALLTAGADRLGRAGVDRALLRLAPGRQSPGPHRDALRPDAHSEADPHRAARSRSGAFNLAVVTRKLRGATTEERVEGWSNHFVTALAARRRSSSRCSSASSACSSARRRRGRSWSKKPAVCRIPLSAGGQTGTLIITPGTVGQNHYRLELGSGHEGALVQHPLSPTPHSASSLPERQTGQIDVPLLRLAIGRLRGTRLGAGVSRRLADAGHGALAGPTRLGRQRQRARSLTSRRPADAPPPPPLFGPSRHRGACSCFVLGIAGIVFAVLGGTPVVPQGGRWARHRGRGDRRLVLLLQARLPALPAAAVAPGRQPGGASIRWRW